MSESSEAALRATKRWLEAVVLGLNLCPFAHEEFKDDRVRYRVSEHTNVESCLHELVAECQLLDDDPAIATTLLIYPQGFHDFESYLDYLTLSEDLLRMEGRDGVYQLASFHPLYRFEGAPPDDPANLTNRSPHPMLHILREQDISDALAHYADPEGIPKRNQEVCRALGIAGIRALLLP